MRLSKCRYGPTAAATRKKVTNLGFSRALAGFAAVSALLACLLPAFFAPSRALADEARHVSVTFLLTSDVYKMNEEGGRGGLPRTAALVK